MKNEDEIREERKYLVALAQNTILSDQSDNPDISSTEKEEIKRKKQEIEEEYGDDLEELDYEGIFEVYGRIKALDWVLDNKVESEAGKDEALNEALSALKGNSGEGPDMN